MKVRQSKTAKIELWPLVFLIVFVVAGLALFFTTWNWATSLILIGIGLLPLVIALK